MHQGGFGEQRWAPSKNVSVGAGEAGHRHRQQKGTGGLWSPGGARDGAAETPLPQRDARRECQAGLCAEKQHSKAIMPWLPLPAPQAPTSLSLSSPMVTQA